MPAPSAIHTVHLSLQMQHASIRKIWQRVLISKRSFLGSSNDVRSEFYFFLLPCIIYSIPPLSILVGDYNAGRYFCIPSNFH